jgi:hypothetical protein
MPITTADGLKLDNVPVIVQLQAVPLIGFRVHGQSGFERRDASRFKCLRYIKVLMMCNLLH